MATYSREINEHGVIFHCDWCGRTIGPRSDGQTEYISLDGEGCFCGLKCATEFSKVGFVDANREQPTGPYYDEDLGMVVAYDADGHLL